MFGIFHHSTLYLNTIIVLFERSQFFTSVTQSLPIKNLDPVHKDFYRWHVYNYLLLFNYAYHTFCKWLGAMVLTALTVPRHQVAQ